METFEYLSKNYWSYYSSFKGLLGFTYPEYLRSLSSSYPLTGEKKDEGDLEIDDSELVPL